LRRGRDREVNRSPAQLGREIPGRAKREPGGAAAMADREEVSPVAAPSPAN